MHSNYRWSLEEKCRETPQAILTFQGRKKGPVYVFLKWAEDKKDGFYSTRQKNYRSTKEPFWIY